MYTEKCFGTGPLDSLPEYAVSAQDQDTLLGAVEAAESTAYFNLLSLPEEITMNSVV